MSELTDGGFPSFLQLVRVFESRRSAPASPADRLSAIADSVLARDAAGRVLAGGKLRGTDMVDFDVEGEE
jgi:hypothetical protein